MEKEALFAKTLEEIKQLAKIQNNCIEEEQVKDAFLQADMALEEEQFALVFDYLKKNKIGIGAPLEETELLTEDEQNYLQSYLDVIEKLPVVRAGEKEAIIRMAMAQDTDAVNRLVEIYLPDVVNIAKLYVGQGVFLEDLIGEGNLALSLGAGMLGCLEEWNQADGMLGKMIMDAMEQYILENSAALQGDEKVAEKINEIVDKAKDLAETLGKKVTPEELAEEAEIPLETIQEVIRITGNNIEEIETQ